MRALPVFRKTLRDQRFTVAGIGFALFLLAWFHIAIYPSYHDSFSQLELGMFEGLAGEGGDITSPAGFLTNEYYSWAPLLVVVLVVIGATGTTLGEESAGTMDLLLAQPVRRWRVVAEKSAAIALGALIAMLCGWVGFLVGKATGDFAIGPVRLLEGVLSTLPLALVYLAVALLASTVLPSRTLAASAAIGLVVADYFLNMVGALVSAVDPWRDLSPFYWSNAGHYLAAGFDWVRAGALVALAGVLFALAMVAFERRDLTSGGREWTAPWRRRKDESAEEADAGFAGEVALRGGGRHPFPIFAKTLRDQRFSMVAMGFVLFAIAILIAAIFPTYRKELEGIELPSIYQGMMGEASDISSPEGFFGVEFFWWVPILLLVLAAIHGTGAIAAEESAGSLDLLLAQPVKRWRVLTEKVAAIVVGIAVAAIGGWLGFLAIGPFVDIDLSPWRTLAATVSMLPLVYLFLGIALLAAAFFPSRSLAAATVIGLIVAGWFLNSLGASVDVLDPWRVATPFHWYDGGGVLLNGIDAVRSGAMLAIAVALFGAALVAFERRDVSSTGREWTLRRRARRPAPPAAETPGTRLSPGPR